MGPRRRASTYSRTCSPEKRRRNSPGGEVVKVSSPAGEGERRRRDLGLAAGAPRLETGVIRGEDAGEENPARGESAREPSSEQAKLIGMEEVKERKRADQRVGISREGIPADIGGHRADVALLQRHSERWRGRRVRLDGLDSEAASGEPKRRLSGARAQVKGAVRRGLPCPLVEKFIRGLEIARHSTEVPLGPCGRFVQ